MVRPGRQRDHSRGHRGGRGRRRADHRQLPAWSNLPKIDGTSVAIDFPLLTQLIQQDWDRVMGGEDGQLPGKGFLIAYHSSAAAVGRLAEDLLCQVVLERLLAAYWPEGRVVVVQDAVRSGELVAPSSGERCDDLVIVDRSGVQVHRRRLVVSAPDGAQGRPAAHQERPRRSTGHDRRRAGELAAGPSRGRVAAEQGRVACWPVYRLTLAMLTYAFLVVAAATQHARPPPPLGLIPLTCNEIQHLFATLVAAPSPTAPTGCAGRGWPDPGWLIQVE